MIAAAALLLLILAFAAFRKSSTEPDILTDLPEEQKQFCQIIGTSGANNLGKAIASFGPAGKFSAWHGQGSVHSQNGKIIAVTFIPACPDSAVSIPLEDASGITTDSAFGRALQASDFSKGMIVSGRLVANGNRSPLVAQFVSPARFGQHTANTGWFASLFQQSISPVSGAIKAPAGGAPIQQRNFCQLLLNEKVEIRRLEKQKDDQHNPFLAGEIAGKQEKLFNKLFDDLYSVVGSSGTFTNWKGKLFFSPVRKLFDDHPEYITFIFYPNCLPVENLPTLATIKDDWSDTHFHYDANSPLFKSLQTLDISKDVIVSGQFLWAPPPPDPSVALIRIDNSHRFYPLEIEFDSRNCCHFAVRITSVSP
jgi:hypothetical protein